MIKQILVPDVGEAEDVEVIEVLVSVGDSINADDSLVVLESDKASMEIPSPMAGVVKSIAVKEGDTVDEGSLILELDTAVSLEIEANDPEAAFTSVLPAAKTTDQDVAPAKSEGTADKTIQENVEIDIVVPDVGEADEVVLTEYLVAVGDQVNVDDSLVVLESDKASMEIPSPFAGTVAALRVEVGLQVQEGDVLLSLIAKPSSGATLAPLVSVDQAPSTAASLAKAAQAPHETSSPAQSGQATSAGQASVQPSGKNVYAGPAVRKIARQFGVELGLVKGTGRKGRVLKEDVQAYVKKQLASPASSGASSGAGIPPIPSIDFSKFGETELRPMSRIKQATAKNLHRSWLNVPHVTQFDEADITELEIFRKTQNAELVKSGQKLTPLAFMVAACVSALKQFPQFNASIEPDYKNLILKKYYNIGVAVGTPQGLVVPVLKDADAMRFAEIEGNIGDFGRRARDGKLSMDEMTGGTFTITNGGVFGSLNSMPILNVPQSAILGMHKIQKRPVAVNDEVVIRPMMYLAMSYDHRIVDGREAVSFLVRIKDLIEDPQRIMLDV